LKAQDPERQTCEMNIATKALKGMNERTTNTSSEEIEKEEISRAA